MVDVFDPANFVAVKVKYIKFSEILKVFYLFDVILAKHKHSKGWNCMQVRDLFYVVIVKV